MAEEQNKLELTSGNDPENIAHRQIDSLLRDYGHSYELFHLPKAGYKIIIRKTLPRDFLEEAAREARQNAVEASMSHEMIKAIEVGNQDDCNFVAASDVWLVERIVREACKKQRRNKGSATS